MENWSSYVNSAHGTQNKENILTWAHPDRPFHNFRASRSGDRRISKLQICERIDGDGVLFGPAATPEDKGRLDEKAKFDKNPT